MKNKKKLKTNITFTISTTSKTCSKSAVCTHMRYSTIAFCPTSSTTIKPTLRTSFNRHDHITIHNGFLSLFLKALLAVHLTARTTLCATTRKHLAMFTHQNHFITRTHFVFVSAPAAAPAPAFFAFFPPLLCKQETNIY